MGVKANDRPTIAELMPMKSTENRIGKWLGAITGLHLGLIFILRQPERKGQAKKYGEAKDAHVAGWIQVHELQIGNPNRGYNSWNETYTSVWSAKIWN